MHLVIGTSPALRRQSQVDIWDSLTGQLHLLDRLQAERETLTQKLGGWLPRDHTQGCPRAFTYSHTHVYIHKYVHIHTRVPAMDSYCWYKPGLPTWGTIVTIDCPSRRLLIYIYTTNCYRSIKGARYWHMKQPEWVLKVLLLIQKLFPKFYMVHDSLYVTPSKWQDYNCGKTFGLFLAWEYCAQSCCAIFCEDVF